VENSSKRDWRELARLAIAEQDQQKLIRLITELNAALSEQRRPLSRVEAEWQWEVDPLIAIAGEGGVSLFNSMGDAWTADYLKITGELDVVRQYD